MRIKNKLNIFIITFVIIFAISTISTNNKIDNFRNNDEMVLTHDKFDLKTLKTSGYWDNFSFILIDGNWSTVAKYEWCSGNGSWSNPYIIENITIDASDSPTGSGIYINNSKNDYFVIRNCTIYNAGNEVWDAGIKLENTNNGTLSNNKCSGNWGSGITLFNDCKNNTIMENIANDNWGIGVYLWYYCTNNNISGNTLHNNYLNGISLYDQCDNNIISGNDVSNSGSPGIEISSYSDGNTITENYIYFSIDDWNLFIVSSTCNNNICKKNILVSEDENYFYYDGGTNTINVQNYFLPVIPSLYVCVIDQSFSKEEFIITMNISSGLGSEINPWILSIQIWWNGTIVNSTNIIELGTGLYNITLTPELVEPGQDPILLNMTIISANHQNKYFELNLAVDPEAVGIYPPSTSGQPSGDGNGDKGEGEPTISISGIDLFIMGIALVFGLAGIAIFLIRKRMRIENI